jgi:hypothetical protein
MDRLARNLEDLRRLVRELTSRGVRVEFVKERLVFSGEDAPIATLLLSVLGAFAEFERALIRERQLEASPSPRPTAPTPVANPPSPRPGRATADPGRGRGTQGRPGPRVRHQTANPLPVPVTAIIGIAVGPRPSQPQSGQRSSSCTADGPADFENN